MIIECPYCESKVDGKVISEHKSYDDEIGAGIVRLYFLNVHNAKNP